MRIELYLCLTFISLSNLRSLSAHLVWRKFAPLIHVKKPASVKEAGSTTKQSLNERHVAKFYLRIGKYVAGGVYVVEGTYPPDTVQDPLAERVEPAGQSAYCVALVEPL